MEPGTGGWCKKSVKQIAATAAIGAALASICLVVCTGAVGAVRTAACTNPHVREHISLPGTPWAAASALGSVWVLTRDGQTGAVVRVDTSGGKVVSRISVPLAPRAVAYGFGSLWVVGEGNGVRGSTLLRLDPDTGAITARIHDARFGVTLAVTRSAVWVGGGDATPRVVFLIDPSRNTVSRRVSLGKSTVMSLTAHGDQLWSAGSNGLVKVTSGAVARSVAVGATGSQSLSFAAAFAGGTVWAAQAGRGSTPTGQPGALVPISATTGKRGERIPLPIVPTAITAVGGNIWVAGVGAGPYVLLVDPVTRRVQQVPIPGLPSGFVVANGQPWVLSREPNELVRVC
jgi:hypothetical protein